MNIANRTITGTDGHLSSPSKFQLRSHGMRSTAIISIPLISLRRFPEFVSGECQLLDKIDQPGEDAACHSIQQNRLGGATRLFVRFHQHRR